MAEARGRHVHVAGGRRIGLVLAGALGAACVVGLLAVEYARLREALR